MSSFFVFTAAGAFGYFIFNLLSHPGSTIKNKLPHIKIKWIQIMPNVRIHVRGRVIFLHHWMNLTIVFVISIIVNQGFLDLISTKGIIVGGIIQGLTYPDWKKIIARSLEKN